ncbi:group III truncated hemoglobin [Asticcacaulis excentricus]|uniref:Globin n=1 Tax=Asticcacaulis excentricus (strain ATCC 15261 / DSM 4724 / KCTC 12464 / NCIMB 9791 / VKM B-1370 / CB 48) TaxID=573065 RepID=E8RL06_ASTEC|nr:group III truncated hemoglobin [Asticcacaulis excentricus]ADU13619.1 globin [Asticcacaulis excentricus CB 48]
MSEPTFATADLRNLVERFYERARRDALLGPVFEAAVDDWPAHFDMLTAFWSMVMNGPRPDMPVFKGRPLPKHLALPLKHQHFDRWLDLWADTTAEVFDTVRAEALREKAWRIGQSFQAAQAMNEMVR